MDAIELIEEIDTPIHSDRMTERVAHALAADPRFNLEFPKLESDRHYCLRSLGWVGQFGVEDTLIVVAPRHPEANIFDMLDTAYGLRPSRVFERNRATMAFGEIFQRAAAILADEAQDRIHRGLYRRHVQHAEDLCFAPSPVRGPLATLFHQDPYLRCRYDDNTAILQDNQILLWALHAASKARLNCEDVARKMLCGYRALAGSLDLTDEIANYCFDQFYRRLATEHRSLHGLCRLILEHTGPALPAGAAKFVPFAIYMPTLFRAFVVRWLKANLPDKYKIRPRYTARLQPNAMLEFRADIVIEARALGRPLMVLDTKYQNEAEPPKEDVQRAAASAVDFGVVEATLVYPSAPQNNSPMQIGAISVRSAGFDLDRPLADAGNDFLKQIRLTV